MAKARIPKSARFTAKSVRPPQGLPDRETLLKFIREAGETDKADMAKAFGLKGADRRALRDMVKQLQAEGALGKRGRKGFSESGALPEVGVVDVVERDPDGELLVKGMHITPYDHGNIFNQDPLRVRRLLAHKNEIRRLHQQCKLQGYTLVPLSLYFKHGRVKMELGLCKGKKLYDKRADAAQRDAKRSIDRAMKSNGKYY